MRNRVLKGMYVDRFIFTGPPGSGKTTLLQHLAQDGFAIAAEAATDVIATKQRQGVDEPWRDPSFIDAIARLQEERQVALGGSTRIQLYDRSPICTVALANWLGHPISDGLHREIDRMLHEQIYRALFLLNQPSRANLALQSKYISSWCCVDPLNPPRQSGLGSQNNLLQERSRASDLVNEQVIRRTDGKRGDSSGANSVRPASEIRT